MSQTTPTPQSTPAPLLAQVADPTAPQPQPPQVVQALLDTERAAKRPPLALPLEALLGQWQLRFAALNKPTYKAGKPTGKGLCWPPLTPATLSLSRPDPNSDQLTLENQIRFGPLAATFSGPAKFLAQKNLLAFTFVQLQIDLGSLRLLRFPIKGQVGIEPFATTPIAKLPFFSFFAATPQYIAARGRGGGLALWIAAGSEHPR